ncbi:MAG: hypothetical protein ACI8XB_001450 [Patiriisocius sp.]|jgi:hypothetical protein
MFLNLDMKKEDLPEKICVVCGLPFPWRKKWEKNGEEVKYCSKKRNEKSKYYISSPVISYFSAF